MKEMVKLDNSYLKYRNKSKKLSSEENKLLLSITERSFSEIFNDILEEDKEEKKRLINKIAVFNKIYKKTGGKNIKDVINSLIKDLEIINSKIKKLREVI